MKTFNSLTQEKQEKLIDKVRKLLALSGSPNEHEAALAAQKAKEIIDEYNITLTELEVKQFIEKKYSLGGRPSKWKVHLANAVANGFDSKIYMIMGKTSHIVFVGTKVDAEVSHYVFEYLMNTTVKLIKNHIAEEKEKHRNKILESLGVTLPTYHVNSTTSYAFGIVLALETKIKAFADKPVKHVVAGEKDLMTLKGKELQDYWDNKFGNPDQHVYTGTILDTDSYKKGYEAGKDIPLHQAIQ